jgi:cell wall assembly regulator SMI1
MTTDWQALIRLDRWLARHRQRYRAGMLPGASPGDLDDLQKKINFSLPDDLRTWLGWHNGQEPDLVGHFLENWDLMSSAEIAEVKQALDADRDSKTGWQKAWIPFLDDDQGDYIVLDTSRTPPVVRAFVPGAAKHPELASSLQAWLDQYVRALEQGDYVEDTERGTMIRKTNAPPRKRQ